MTCPGCGAAMRVEPGKDYLICDYCGYMHFPDADPDGVRILGDPTKWPCPRCSLPLLQASIAGAQVVSCGKCHGMLIDMEEFLVVIEELRSRHEHSEYAGQQPDWRDLDRDTTCPKCRQRMDTHPYAGPGNVIIDTCESCSLNWLDYGELQRIVRAPDGHYAIAIDEEERDKLERDEMTKDHS
jgi:Zn-finger nucleic acid-binding protein